MVKILLKSKGMEIEMELNWLETETEKGLYWSKLPINGLVLWKHDRVYRLMITRYQISTHALFFRSDSYSYIAT